MRYFLLLIYIFSLMNGLKAQEGETTMVFIGDSLCAGHGIEQEKAFPALLEQRWQNQGKKIRLINASISGSTSASGVSRLKWQLKAKPDWVFISLGANDGLRGVKAEATYENLKKMITLAQEQRVGVIVAGMKLPPNYGEQFRKDFENVYKKLAKMTGVNSVGFLLHGVAGVEELNLEDGIHPNEKGHVLISKNLAPLLEKILWP